MKERTLSRCFRSCFINFIGISSVFKDVLGEKDWQATDIILEWNMLSLGRSCCQLPVSVLCSKQVSIKKTNKTKTCFLFSCSLKNPSAKIICK